MADGKRMLNEIAKGKNKLGEEITRKLYILGKTQKWLAEECGCTKQAISEIVHGKSKPSAKMSEKIAKVFDMEAEEVRRMVLEKVV